MIEWLPLILGAGAVVVLVLVILAWSRLGGQVLEEELGEELEER